MRKFIINVNGSSYEVEVEEVGNDGTVNQTVERPVAKQAPKKQAEAPKKQAAPKQEPKKEVKASEGQEVVEAPMPGNIWKILVAEGDSVNEGDVLLILEAMKMENEIVAPRSGKVASINTTEGSTVNAGDSLVVLD